MKLSNSQPGVMLDQLFFSADTDASGSASRQPFDAVISVEYIRKRLSAGEKVDLSQLSRPERLSIINAFLAANNLRLLEGLGDAAQGQIEWKGINKFTSDDIVARIDFDAALGVGKNEKRFNHLTFIGASTAFQQGVVVVPLLNCEKSGEEYLLMLQEYRPVVGRYVIGFPRGFPDKANFMKSQPVQNAFRELDEETGILEKAFISTARKISDVYENTGAHNVKIAVVEVVLDVNEEVMKSISSYVHTEEFGTKARTLLIVPELVAGIVEDQHSAAALLKWLSHRNQNSSRDVDLTGDGS